MRITIFVAAALLLSACVGQLGGVQPSDDGGSTRDAPGLDGGPRVDAGPLPDAGPGVDAASPVDAYTPGPCDAITCGANARCEPTSASCVCLPGFVGSGAACVAAMPGDPGPRTTTEVCDAWDAGHVENARTAWTPGGGGACDPGTMTADAIGDALRRINMFRWMIGLGPVVDRPADHARQQQCARMMDANDMLSHTPPTGWDCYTAEGAAGAGSSNLALGVTSSADTIDLYVSDNGVPSLGHRRWVFNGPLDSVGLGHVGRGGCLGVFHSGATPARAWTAWPQPGPVPLEAISGTTLWSFHADGARAGTVRIVRVSDGSNVSVTPMALPDGYGPSTVAWSSTGLATAGTYRITVSGIPAGEITYDVTLVACP